jgi:pSer/pThr/pTyr-binding forkhead associated (FHA) protein
MTPMVARLRMLEGRPETESVSIEEGTSILIGRSVSCSVRLDDASVSRYHCVVTLRDGRLLIHDLASRYGTLVNNQAINIMHKSLHHGDRISIGSAVFEVDLGVA